MSMSPARAALVSVADSALQRITRGIRLALPNSIRISGSSGALEFLRIRTGGRYRVDTPGTRWISLQHRYL